MKQNIGPKNKAARALIGAALIDLSALFFPNTLSWIGFALGTIFVLESIFSYCVVHGVRGTKDMR